MESDTLTLSKLPKTWFFDLDGTLVKHNGYIEQKEQVLAGVKEFLLNVAAEDFVIITTARNKEFKEITEKTLKDNAIRYDLIIYDLPCGERILVNDRKPSGLQMAYAINPNRDIGLSKPKISFDGSL